MIPYLKLTLLRFWPIALAAIVTAEWVGNGSVNSSVARLLAIGDFDSFNEVLSQGVSLQLGDLPPVSVPLLFFSLDIVLTEVYCTDLYIGDIQIDYSEQKVRDNLGELMDELTLGFDVSPFAMNCYGKYSYDAGIFRSSGDMTLNSRANGVDIQLGFRSLDFELYPPNRTVVNTCDANINIYNLEFSRGIESLIAAIFEQQVADLVENEAASGKSALRPVMFRSSGLLRGTPYDLTYISVIPCHV